MGLAYPGMTPAEIMATIASEKRNRVVFVDSEGGRGRHYAPGPGIEPDFRDTFPYDYGEIRAPYTPENYKDAITAADEAGYTVIIVDSMSHEYESEGGIMEIADEAERGTLKPGVQDYPSPDDRDGWKCFAIKPVKSPGNWKDAKTRHKKMVNRAVQARAHVIFCLRAEEKMELRRVPMTDRQGNPMMRNGEPQMKTEVVPAEQRPLLDRWAPICEKRFMYEMTVSFLLLPSNPGVGHPIKKLQNKFIPMFPEGHHLGVDNGRQLAEWAMGRAADVKQGETGAAPDLSASKPRQTPAEWVEQYKRDLAAVTSLDGLVELQDRSSKAIDKLKKEHPVLHSEVVDENGKRFRELNKPEDPPAGDEDGGFVFDTPAEDAGASHD